MNFFALSSAALMMMLALFPVSGSAQQQNPKPPLKVFILAGQSNMEGAGVIQIPESSSNGGKGTLEYLVKDSSTAGRFKHTIDANGDWVTRDDVWIRYLGRKGGLSVGYGARDDRIGPEFQFGHAVGEQLEEQVLLIKTAWGGKSLDKDFRPPSSGGTVGPFYTEMIAHIKQVLANLKEEFPDYDGNGYELAGFGWHQGWNDRVNQAANDAYEENMVHFINDVRKDLGVEKLPFVIAETGMSGHEEKHPRALSLMQAQAAAAGREEFKGNVAFVGTKDFYRPKEVSPSGQAYHWNSNAETYFLIGDAMARAMLSLINGQSKGQAARFEVTAPPAELNVDPFYKKFVSANGLPVLSSEKVNDYALKEAAFLVTEMLALRPDVLKAMVNSGSRLCVIGYNEFTTELPGWSHLTPRDFWDARARGMGGSLEDPLCSCAEENLLCYPGDPYSTESIVIHELAHNIHLRGVVNLDPTFDGRVEKTYNKAMAAGLWKGKYASVNHHEYFAEGVQSWFDNNRPPDHDHNHVDTRAELIEYDPGLAALCREVFGDTELKYTKPATRLHGHLAGYDPDAAPTFEWPERLKEIKTEIRRRAEERSKGANLNEDKKINAQGDLE
ncbi:MAG: sialate O-acetylesterase [Verrucomicrobiales bacterium]